jgi:hypothetical protein
MRLRYKMREIIIIAAMSENQVIGKDNAMPWSIKGNLAHFKEMTMGWPCIMGRKTWESLPKKPLQGRLNIIISRTMTVMDSSVPKDELQALSPKTSSVPKDELCPQRRALSPRKAQKTSKSSPPCPPPSSTAPAMKRFSSAAESRFTDRRFLWRTKSSLL